ncbi:MAG TPA: lipoyl(octanoyl) transferase LipB [Gammaproteobacteria bacterium]|nr:lipoyl(octanoyl) transferase LipB [Gammaproteobacteria bacterium]
MSLSSTSGKDLIVRHLGLRDYPAVWHNMQHFTDTRTPDTADEIWLLEHPPVFTLGLNGKPEHILDPGDIPVVKCDRGGQVTYHGPGQLIAYLLLDLRRRELGVKILVHKIEQTIIDLLYDNGIHGQRREGAPGVYVNDAKIAALGLRIRRGCCYHGLSLNVDMDLEPFSRINPCGYTGLETTQLSEHLPDSSLPAISKALREMMQAHLNN